MNRIARNFGIACAGIVAATGLIALGAVALIRPRTGNTEIDERWEHLRRYRYAHRGLHRNGGPAPENSLEAFRLARIAGFGSELDVHLCATGELVVVHDHELQRACGVDACVEQMSFAELEQPRLFGSDERIPLLEQVLEVYEDFGEGATPPLVVELKTTVPNYAELTEKTLELLDAHHVPYCVESFDPRPLVWLRRHRPDVLRGQLSQDWLRRGGAPGGAPTAFVLTHLLSNALARPDFVAYRYEDRGRAAVQLATNTLGGKLATWTLKSPEQLYATEAAGGLPIFEGFVPEA